MSSARGTYGTYGYGLPARPSERLKPRISEDSNSSRSSPGKDSDGPRPAIPRAGHSRLPSRVPPSSSTKRPALVQSSSLPLPDRHSRSWGSSSTAMSENSRSHTQSASGSSSSTTSYDSGAQARNVLRRKKPSISRDASLNAVTDSTTSVSSSSSNPPSQAISEVKHVAYYDRSLTEKALKSQDVENDLPEKQLERPPTIYPELDRYRHVKQYSNSSDEQGFQVPFRLATQDLPPPTPASILFSGSSSQLSASPSTKWSGSPGPGPYSRDTTPTSISSQSPSLVTTTRLSTKGRLYSPALSRPPVTRRRAGSIPGDANVSSVDPQGLAAVRESLNSSSSSSTVRDGERNPKKRDLTATLLPPLPPSPPPRKSSQKLRKTESDDESLPSKPRGSDQATRGSPSPPKSAHESRPSQLASPSKEDPPRRPSRDGMPDMQQHLFGRIPVVHSNIPASYLSPERRGSEPTIPTTNARTPNASSLPTKNPSTSSLPAVQTTFSRDRQMTSLQDKDSKKKAEVSTTPSSAATPSPKVGSSLGGRFAFFGRKKKASVPEPDDKTTANKSGRKGPAAGTGHEGYGRLGASRRRSGNASTLTRGGTHTARDSEDSLNSTDSFFADRINPVVISGGSIVENKNARTKPSGVGSSPSIAQGGRPSLDSRADPEVSPTSRDEVTLWSTVFPQPPSGQSRSRRPSDSSDSDGITMKSTLAFRRSQQRLRTSSDNPLRLPHPINTAGFANSPMTSFDTSVMSMSDDSGFELQREGTQAKDPAHPPPRKLSKKERSPRRWNFFGRSQSRAPSKKEEMTTTTQEPIVEKKPVPFYAMLDPSEHEEEVADIREVLRNADVYTGSPDPSRTPEMPPTAFEMPIKAAKEAAPAPSDSTTRTTLPAAKGPFRASQASMTHLPPASNLLSSGRPSRLPQVGRIPAVVSKRPQQVRHVPSKSFSRPFRHSLQAAPVAPRKPDADSVAKGPSPPRPLSPKDATEGSNKKSGSDGNSTIFSSGSETTSAAAATLSQAQQEFLRFSPRKNSESTQGTGSTASTHYALAEATAIIPRPEDPPAEDEIWDEYNDLLEDNMGPRASATSSKGIPFHLERYQTKPTKDKELESPTLVPDSRKTSTLSKATASSAYSADMTERIRKAFQPHASPTTPYSLSEFVTNYGNRDATTPVGPQPLVVPASRRSSASSCKTKSSDSGSSSFDEAQPLAQVNIRVGSMTVSKWLTFGHVLFSDVRHDLTAVDSKAPQHSILVLDGLGNDDWSFYAAETYAGATFFNLSPRAPLPAELQNAVGFPASPSNHHQIQYLSQLEKFPFAAQSFTSIVLRFPVAAPESHYRNILTEARRTLRPGGYFELAILDADLNNMGTIGRRAIRGLKERIHEETQNINLSSTADLLVRLLGQYGFSGVKTARVGVPVASSLGHSTPDGPDKARLSEERKRRKKDPPSLAEMMNENGPTADEGITKMVSRVGRWWYTRCYESMAGVATQRSIWADKALLRECEELGTSLKLTVCYARAPDTVTIR